MINVTKSDFPVYTIKDEQKKKGADAMKHKFTSLFITVLVASVIGFGVLPVSAEGGKIIVGYFPAWGIYYDYFVKDIDASKLTHINYAFINVQDSLPVVGVTRSGVGDAWADYQRAMSASESVDGVGDRWDQSLKGNWNQLRKLKEQNPHLKVLVSLGGWTWSGGFSDAALPENRNAFVRACIDAFILGNIPYDPGSNTGGSGTAAGVFDGIDIDWEYPVCCGLGSNTYRPEDKQNYTDLLAEFRRQLDAIDPNLLLTIAAPAGPHNINNLELKQFPQYLNFINLMTYDYHGSWDPRTGHLAPMYRASDDPFAQPGLSMDETVETYINMGIPEDQLVLGLPFYGRSWTGVSAGPEGNGLYQGATGAGPGERGEPGMLHYCSIIETYEPTYTKYYHTEAKVPWLYNGSNFISYDDPTAIARKAEYILRENMAGAMFWNLMSDLKGNPTPSDSLLYTLWNGLNNGSVTYECSDGIDNDGDGLVDLNDPGCENAQDNDEYNVPPPQYQCNDGQDNDGDGLIDLEDPGCENAQDDDEYNSSGELEWEVRIQDDWGNGYCANVTVTNSTNESVEWAVTIDVEGTVNSLWNGQYVQNNNSIKVQGADWNRVLDAGRSTSFGFCAKRDQPPPQVQCSDGIDNDGDGLVDLNDPGCENAQDDDEYNSSGELEWEVRIQDDWGNGYCASVIIRNNSAQDQDWQVTLDVVGSITSLWGAAYEEKNGHLLLEGLSWNNIVPAGGTITSVGFCAKR